MICATCPRMGHASGWHAEMGKDGAVSVDEVGAAA
ncbi:hypothetical protein Y590_24205 [Methylobacterium sp. AMS5]|nr:hypothetical protein Y590_24205 [Methylobacterium sp. AMS5]